MRTDEILKRISLALKVLAYVCGFFLLICLWPNEQVDHSPYIPWAIFGLVLLVAGAIVCEEVSSRAWNRTGPAAYHPTKAHPGHMRDRSQKDMGSTGEWDEEWDYQRPLFSCAWMVFVFGVIAAWGVRPQLLHEFRFVWAGYIAAWITTALLLAGIVWLLDRFNVKLQMELTDPQPVRIWAAIRSACAWVAGMCTLAILTWLISCGAAASPYVVQALPVLGIAIGGIILSSFSIR